MIPETPPDLRPGALLLAGIRRGALLVFLPVALAAQAVAWLAYAASGWFHAWSWAKIGLAYALLAMRVPFEASLTGAAASDGPAVAPLTVAIGALTVAILVLAYRCGGAQARGLEERPGRAAASGAAVGIGVGVCAFAAAFVVRLGFPTFGIASLRPVLWAAFVVPVVVTGAAGAVGGVAVAREALSTATGWRSRLGAAAAAGAVGAWWGLVLAFVAFLVLAAAYPGVTTAYARAASRLGGGGAVLLVHHALLLPNQSALLLAVTMGSPASVSLAAGARAATISTGGVSLSGDAGSFLAAFLALPVRGVGFPGWFVVFRAVPLVASFLAGRRAGEGVRAAPERVVRGALAGGVFALLVTAAAWASRIELPLRALGLIDRPSIGVATGRTLVVSLAWGVIGAVAGAVLATVAPTQRSGPTPEPR